MNQKATKTLFDKNLITKEQYQQIATYRSLHIFSLNKELKFLLYLSVLLFTTGIGILIYNTIELIGHEIIIALITIVMLLCYYFSFKKAPQFQSTQTQFESPVMEYVVLTANLLTCILIGYLQIQYTAFGSSYSLATIIPTAIGLFSGYYFDNKNVLSLAITGLAASIGLTVIPQSVLQNNFYDTLTLGYVAIALGVIFISWNHFCYKINFKTHFALVFFTFALHLIMISCINNSIYNDYFFIFAIILALAAYYFYHCSYQTQSVSLFLFTILYGFIGLNIALFHVIERISLDDFLEPLLVLSPFYFVGSIFIFIKMIKKFNSGIKK